jgi:hypothetical protein
MYEQRRAAKKFSLDEISAPLGDKFGKGCLLAYCAVLSCHKLTDVSELLAASVIRAIANQPTNRSTDRPTTTLEQVEERISLIQIPTNCVKRKHTRLEETTVRAGSNTEFTRVHCSSSVCSLSLVLLPHRNDQDTRQTTRKNTEMYTTEGTQKHQTDFDRDILKLN